jgi:hypothetical protein
MSVNPVTSLNPVSSHYCMMAGVRSGMVYSGSCPILLPSGPDPGLHASMSSHVRITTDWAVLRCLRFLICGIWFNFIHSMSSVTSIRVKPLITNDWAVSMCLHSSSVQSDPVAFITSKMLDAGCLPLLRFPLVFQYPPDLYWSHIR